MAILTIFTNLRHKRKDHGRVRTNVTKARMQWIGLTSIFDTSSPFKPIVSRTPQSHGTSRHQVNLL